MKIDIKREDNQKGFIFKKPEFVGRVTVTFEDSEKEMIKQLAKQEADVQVIMMHDSKRGTIDRNIIEIMDMWLKKDSNAVWKSTCFVKDNTTRDGFIETVKDSLVELKQRFDMLQSANDSPASETLEL